MDHAEVKNAIVGLLEEIVGRTNYINRKHPSKDLALDIDLVKDDLRLLYRHLESLKEMAYAGADDAPSGNPEPAAFRPAEVSPPPPEQTPPPPPAAAPPIPEESAQPAAGPSSFPAEQQDTPASSGPLAPPDVSPSPTREAAEISPPEPEPEKSGDILPPEEPAVQQPIPYPPGAPSSSAGDHAVPPADEAPPAAPSPSSGAAASPPSPKKGNPSSEKGNKAVIDLLAGYAERTIGDLYMQEDNSLHKRISDQKEDRSIGARMQQEPISSLRDVIGVNEKFLFINELFQGDIQAYNEAIARLNEMGGVKEAFDYLNKLGMEYAWDAGRSKTTIEKLANYVQRKHMNA